MNFAYEVAKLALLLAALRIAEQDARISELQGQLKLAGPASPSTPSGQRPVYTKRPAPQRSDSSSSPPRAASCSTSSATV